MMNLIKFFFLEVAYDTAAWRLRKKNIVENTNNFLLFFIGEH